MTTPLHQTDRRDDHPAENGMARTVGCLLHVSGGAYSRFSFVVYLAKTYLKKKKKSRNLSSIFPPHTQSNKKKTRTHSHNKQEKLKNDRRNHNSFQVASTQTLQGNLDYEICLQHLQLFIRQSRNISGIFPPQGFNRFRFFRKFSRHEFFHRPTSP